jgi:hypothetical protein
MYVYVYVYLYSLFEMMALGLANDKTSAILMATSIGIYTYECMCVYMYACM